MLFGLKIQLNLTGKYSSHVVVTKTWNFQSQQSLHLVCHSRGWSPGSGWLPGQEWTGAYLHARKPGTIMHYYSDNLKLYILLGRLTSCLAVQTFLKKNWPFPASFLYFRLFNKQLTVNKMFNVNKILPMTEFKPRTSAIGSDRSTNWATQPLEHILVRRFPCAHHGSHPHFCFIIRLHRTGQTTQTWRTGQALRWECGASCPAPTTSSRSSRSTIGAKVRPSLSAVRPLGRQRR